MCGIELLLLLAAGKITKKHEPEPEWIGIIVARNGKDGTTQVHTMLSDYDSPQDAMGSAEAYVESPDFCYDNGLHDGDWLEDSYVGAVMDYATKINNEEWLWKAGMHIVANSRSGEVPGYAVGHPDPANPPDVGHPSIPTFIWPNDLHRIHGPSDDLDCRHTGMVEETD